MWVNSQNLSTCVKVYYFYVDRDVIKATDINKYNYILATYLSNERALEVYKMMIRHLNTNANKVFEMPRE